jgi:hypothetical protein
VTAVLGLVALTGLTACEPIDDVLAQPSGAVADPEVSAELDALTVAGWAAMTGYSRSRFPHWESQGEGCDTRDRVLQRDGRDVVTADDCKIESGEWFSVYDGESFADPSEVDIDHVVPLANAWRTGAATWTDERREAFANDLTRPQLIAVSASSNRSKGDQDPSQWRPPRQEYWCSYARSWITVKAYWELSVTADEKAALAQMLGTCP